MMDGELLEKSLSVSLADINACKQFGSRSDSTDQDPNCLCHSASIEKV